MNDGQIVGKGIVLNTGSDRDALPVTGGSGRYEGARGSVVATSGRRGVTFAFRLLD